MTKSPKLPADLRPASELAKLRRPPFPGESEAYASARQKLLAEEIEFRRHMTRLCEQRRELPPGPVIQKNYRFKRADGSEVGLRELFGSHDTLISYFWMYGPQRERPCPMCTNFLGAVNGNAPDVEQRAALAVFGRSPVARQREFAAERGWEHLDFVQTVGDDYAKDLGILADDGSEGAAITVFQRDGEQVRLFYGGDATGSRGSRTRSAHGTGYRIAVVAARSNTRGSGGRLVSQTVIQPKLTYRSGADAYSQR